MNTPRILLCALLTVTCVIHALAQDSPAPAQTEMQKWIATTDAQWQAAFKRDVIDVHDAEVNKVKLLYLTTLETAVGKASSAGDLEGAVALRSEQKRFGDTQVLPEKDGVTDAPAVKQVREMMRGQFAKLEKDTALRAKGLHAKYDAMLAQAQTQLTQRQRLDDALLVKAKRDEVAAAWLIAGTVVPAVAHAETANPANAPIAKAMTKTASTPMRGVSPDAATKEMPFVNSLDMKFVPVPETNVLFSIWDTRVRDYAEFARANRVEDFWTRPQKDGVPTSREPDHPVVSVNWEEANAFCAWLTQKEMTEGRLPKGKVYRLPTDEEWSRAVGLPAENGATPEERKEKNSTHFPWGGDYPPNTLVGNYADTTFHAKLPSQPVKWFEDYSDGFATSSPVGSFPPNAFGLYDMGGNVWQWCLDQFSRDEPRRVLRGASWSHSGRGILLSSSRTHRPATLRESDMGFRCVLGAPASQN